MAMFVAVLQSSHIGLASFVHLQALWTSVGALVAVAFSFFKNRSRLLCQTTHQRCVVCSM